MVPKSPPFVFDVGAGSHKTWESWCLGGGCTWTWWTHTWCTAIKELWWDNHHVLGIWSIVHVLVTISKTPSLFHAFSYMIFLACSYFICFVLHVVKTWLDVVFVKTWIHTCTSSEQQIDSYMFALHCSFVLITCTCIA